MTDHADLAKVTDGPLHIVEERSDSPLFTPKGQGLPLPPIAVIGEGEDSTTSDDVFAMVPIPNAFSYPQQHHRETSVELEKTLTATESIESITAGQLAEAFFKRDQIERACTPEMSDSPIFNTSSPLQHQYQDSPQTRSSYVSSTDHSGRLSSSTMASSVPRLINGSNTSLHPDEYGIAFGSPRADKMASGSDESVKEVPEVTAMKHVSVYQVGLGLMSKEAASIEGEIGSMPIPQQPIRVPFALSVPPRAASRPRADSRASSSGGSSSKQSGGGSPVCTRRVSKRASFATALSRDASNGTSEGLMSTPPSLPKIYTESIMSTGRDSVLSLSPISPRSSSLKKAKSRNRVRSKTSHSPIKMMPPQLDSSNDSNSPHHGHKSSDSSGCLSSSSGEDSFDRDFFASLRASPVIDKRVSEQTAMPVTPLNDDARSLMDYLAYSAAGLTDNGPEETPETTQEVIERSSPASPISEEEEDTEQDSILKADGKRLSEIGSKAGSNTTHLLLSGSEDESIDDFLEGILPLVGDSLLVLDVSSTKLTRIPKSISYCIRLEELNVSSTALARPFHNDLHWAKKLGRLRVFTADHCCLPLVPNAIVEIKSLVKLSLQHNRLSHMPSWLHRLSHLETLLLAGNPFQGQWEKICRAFIMSVDLPHAAKATLDGNSASAPLTNGIESDQNAPSFFPEQAKVETTTKDKHTPLRPFIRRMKSQGGDISSLANTFAMHSIQHNEDMSMSLGPSSRRPSLGGASSVNVSGEHGDKKWNTLMRKMGRKASTSQLSSMYASTNTEETTIRERSNSLKGTLRRRPRVEVPAIPAAWQKNTIPASKEADQDDVEVDQKSKLRGLMQYLQDLDDLGCSPTVVTPGSELSLDLSMGSYASSSPSKNMSRSESEISHKSGGSETSLSSQECISLMAPSIKDDSPKRIHILQEILATEDSYIRTLQELVNIYVAPAAASDPHTGSHLISTAERKKVFANVEAILQFHQGALYPALRMVAEPILDKEELDEEAWSALSAKISERVAGVMLKHAAFFRMYTAYVNGVNDAVTRVSQWRSTQKNAEMHLLEQNDVPALGSREKKRIKAFLIKARSDSRHSQLSLETYLHVPVQRIPRYRLLLEDLVRHCPAHRLNDPTILTRALESICSVATLMNESKRQSEKNRRLLDWQSRVKEDFPSPLVQPHRQLIKDGPLLLQRIVTRSSAFHVSPDDASILTMEEEESKNGVTIQVDCLDQQSINKKVTVLLCNDITVVLTNDANHAALHSSVNLYAVLRIKDSVELIGEKTLRVVDAKHILYFSASTPVEAQEWQEAMSKVNQR